ncbi:MAG: S-layer homology domain-containing protein [Clostridia bacterium]|nr:S-layer homology domain-containing protein [Clostridia bacterium]
MKKFCTVLVFCIVMLFGVLYAAENVVLKDAPDFEVFYHNGKVAVISSIKNDETLSKDIVANNHLVERYSVYLPLYLQIDNDGLITRAMLVKNGQNTATEKELIPTNLGDKLEVGIEQIVGMPDGVGMMAETIYQSHKIYKYEINWTVRGLVQKVTHLDVVVLRELQIRNYDYIYEKMINKDYTDIYSIVMSMTNGELTALETYLTAKYGVEWDVDAKLMQEMREINISQITFTDVLENHWAYNVIKSMAIKGILNGYEDKTFRPENYLTRAEAAQVLAKTFGLTEVNKEELRDVSEDYWGYDAIRKASRYIPMNGNDFDSETNITRKDFIVAIMRILGEENKANGNAFSDLEGLSEEEIAKINLAHSLNIVNGYEDGTFRPNEPLTRAEACAILARTK